VVRGNDVELRQLVLLPLAFEVAKEEQAVADDGSAERRAELIAARIGLLEPVALVEIRIGAARGVAVEAVRVASKAIGPRRRHEADRGGAAVMENSPTVSEVGRLGTKSSALVRMKLSWMLMPSCVICVQVGRPPLMPVVVRFRMPGTPAWSRISSIGLRPSSGRSLIW